MESALLDLDTLGGKARKKPKAKPVFSVGMKNE